jgi:site-specific DNA recombinase
MTLRTGTSKTGKVHRYCYCCARHGHRPLHPERLSAVLASLTSRRAAKAAAVSERLSATEKEAHESNERVTWTMS